MSSFIKILILPEMSGKMEVIVPEKQADNSAAELRGIPFHPRDKADINVWKSGDGRGVGEEKKRVNTNFMQVFVQTDGLGYHPFSSCLTYKTTHEALLSTRENRIFLCNFPCTAAYVSPKK